MVLSTGTYRDTQEVQLSETMIAKLADIERAWVAAYINPFYAARGARQRSRGKSCTTASAVTIFRMWMPRLFSRDDDGLNLVGKDARP